MCWYLLFYSHQDNLYFSIFSIFGSLPEICQFYWSFQRSNFLFRWSSLLFLISFIYILIFIISFHLSFCFEFILLFFYQWQLRLFIGDLSSFLSSAFSSINFPLSTALAVSYNFWFLYSHFHCFIKKFPLRFFIIHGLFIRVLFSFQVFGKFCYLLLISIWFYCGWRAYSIWLKFLQVCWDFFMA